MRQSSNGWKLAIQVATIIGFLTTGVVWMETRYAKAAEVSAQFSDVKTLILESRLHDLTRERWNLEGCRAILACRDRAKQIDVDIQQTQEQLSVIRQRGTR